MDNTLNKGKRTTVTNRFNILKSLGYEITTKSAILDFGCGKGVEVQYLKNQGYNIYGCDIKTDPLDHDFNSLLRDDVVRLVNPTDYKLPFEDNTFDLIYSYQVFEHVKNPQIVISEMNRILKPTGITYHHFPTKYRIIESHIKVPFAPAIAKLWWLTFWSLCGIRNKYQKNLPVGETVEWNREYLKNHTNYLSNKSYLNLFNKHFKIVKRCEKAFLFEILKERKILQFISKFNFISFIFRTFHSVIWVTANPRKANLYVSKRTSPIDHLEN